MNGRERVFAKAKELPQTRKGVREKNAACAVEKNAACAVEKNAVQKLSAANSRVFFYFFFSRLAHFLLCTIPPFFFC